MSRVVFEDNFRGPAGSPPNPDFWSPYPWSPDGSTPETGKVALSGTGTLELTLADNTQSAAIWTEGKVRCRPPFVAVARIRYPEPSSYNLWHSFWWAAGDWDRTGEIDFYENGGRQDVFQVATHDWKGNQDTESIQQYPFVAPPAGDLFTFGAVVKPDYVQHQYNGQNIGPRVPVDPAAFDKPGSFRLSFWPAPGVEAKGFPATVHVDLVRVTA